MRQFKAITRATEYIRRTFNEIKREFLSVIDHLETEAEEKDPRERSQNNEKIQEELKIAYSRVSKEELQVLDDLLKQVEEKYPDLNEKVLKRTKRFGVMSWIMGWGIYSNWRQIKAIKKNIKKLYEQNLLQEQQIQDLAHYLNLTATRVQLHDKMLYNIQVRLNRIDHSIGTLNDIVTFNWVSNNMLLDANVIVNRLITGLIVLRNNVAKNQKRLLIEFQTKKANVAQSMGGYLWAVSSLVGEKMQVRCLTETHVEVIKPPLQVIHIGNGCEGYSPSIKIPAKSELTSQNDIAERTTYFLDFNAQYEKSKDMGPWNLFELDKFTEKKLKGMVDMLPALPPMNYDNLNKRIGELDDYPLEIPVAIIAIVLVVSTVFLVATIVVYAYIIFRLRKISNYCFPWQNY